MFELWVKRQSGFRESLRFHLRIVFLWSPFPGNQSLLIFSISSLLSQFNECVNFCKAVIALSSHRACRWFCESSIWFNGFIKFLNFPSFLRDRRDFIKGKLPVAGNEQQFSSTFDRPVAVVWDEEIIRSSEYTSRRAQIIKTSQASFELQFQDQQNQPSAWKLIFLKSTTFFVTLNMRIVFW